VDDLHLDPIKEIAEARIKSDHTRLVHIVNGHRNYGTYGIHGIDEKKRIFSVDSVNSVCSVVSLLIPMSFGKVVFTVLH
jgi:hypothetical protein